VLITLMAEICQIVNSRPIAGIPLDTDFATPLTPSTLLTMNTKHTVDTWPFQQFLQTIRSCKEFRYEEV
jgi:hypothetical protein